MQAIWEFWELQNFNQETGEWDRLVNEKPPNPIRDQGRKITSQKRAVVNESPCSSGLG